MDKEDKKTNGDTRGGGTNEGKIRAMFIICFRKDSSYD